MEMGIDELQVELEQATGKKAKPSKAKKTKTKDPVRVKAGKKSKGKGGRGERQARDMFQAWWGTEFTRTPQSGGFGTHKFREDWNAAGDIVTPDPLFPFCVEVKNAEGWSLDQLLTAPKSDLWTYWQQALEQAPPGKIPLLVFTRNHQPWYFMMAKSAYLGPVDQVMVVQDRVVVGLATVLFSTPKESWLQSHAQQ